MNIVVVGCGKVGFSLAEQLVQEEHDVTIVDSDEEALHRAGRTDLIGFGRECLVRPLGEVRNPAQRESRARPAKGAKPPARGAEKSGARGRQGRGRKK